MTDLVETAALTDSVERDRVGVPVGGRFCMDSGHVRREIGSTGDSLRQTASPALHTDFLSHRRLSWVCSQKMPDNLSLAIVV